MLLKDKRGQEANPISFSVSLTQVIIWVVIFALIIGIGLTIKMGGWDFIKKLFTFGMA